MLLFISTTFPMIRSGEAMEWSFLGGAHDLPSFLPFCLLLLPMLLSRFLLLPFSLRLLLLLLLLPSSSTFFFFNLIRGDGGGGSGGDGWWNIAEGGEWMRARGEYMSWFIMGMNLDGEQVQVHPLRFSRPPTTTTSLFFSPFCVYRPMNSSTSSFLFLHQIISKFVCVCVWEREIWNNNREQEIWVLNPRSSVSSVTVKDLPLGQANY